ncbi:Tetraketide alpha-pyrone reductase 1 [Acorus gramineus]|uniref:Tetraketide alpha-pyrone reductase 1 n=1 Tax=Acorus gramineus TaxID=55184 RepID=A0AAV9AGG7_ACOGR|nr:Tetraketide alpha-pyrone reductase 1 [Acorus gramineus]
MEPKNKVCVTGGNGFIGSTLVNTLLSSGYSVIATYHPSTSPSPHPHPHLSFKPADLLDATAISDAIEGCEGVFHVASPCTLEDPADPESDLVRPAVEGTVNVLEACRRHGVRRVVITSSISALVPNPGWGTKLGAVDERSWTDIDYCKSRQKWYPVSKTLAEKAAWEFAEKYGIDVVAIHPSTCLGPLLQPSLNASSAVLLNLLQGSNDSQEYHWLGCVHVQDVVNAQIRLFEAPGAKGRYLCTNGIYQFKEFAETVAKLYPEYPVHRFTKETQPGLVACKDAAKRLIDLGIMFTSIEKAIQDSFNSMKEKGFLGQPKLQC